MSSSEKPNTAAGETELDVLIRSMQPVLHNETYVFATVDFNFDVTGLSPLMSFKEQKGQTLILGKTAATEAGIDYEFPCQMITLNIHSSLDAVGFLARITTHLAQLNIGVNPVSGFYHDHLFVPSNRATDAMEALGTLSNS